MIRYTENFRDLVAIPFGSGINAVCWRRTLDGDFGEVVARLGAGEGIVTLDEPRLRALPLTDAGRRAVAAMLEDLRLLRAHAARRN